MCRSFSVTKLINNINNMLIIIRRRRRKFITRTLSSIKHESEAQAVARTGGPTELLMRLGYEVRLEMALETV